MNIIDLSMYPEVSGYATMAAHTHQLMRSHGHESYQLGPYTTNDVLDALRKELRQQKEDLQTLIAWVDDGGEENSQMLAAAMWAKYPKP